MRKRFYHKKLIRDKIPKLIKATNDDFETRVMDDLEFETELKKKLVEESKEVLIAPKEELMNELADVLQLIKSITAHYQMNFKDVEKYQREKKKKRGAFAKKLFLIWSTGKGGK